MRALLGLAADRGLRGFSEPGIFDPAVQEMSSYRVADLGFARAEHVSTRGIEGSAALVIEVLSPSDESFEKLRFYGRVGVEELLYIDPETRSFEVRRPAEGGWALASPSTDGWVELVSLAVQLRTIGHRLQIRSSSGTEEV
jgi:Uma2 family endonuclease